MNKIREITKEQYLQTIGKHMKNVTDNTEVIADIWGYAKCLLERKLISEYGFKAIPHNPCASDAQSDFSSECINLTQAG